MKKKWLVPVTVIFCLLTASTAAFGCACCAETGTYSIWTGKPNAYELGVIGDMRFGKKADLFMTEADFDIIKGLDEIKKEYTSESWTAESGEFDLIGSLNNRAWSFRVKTKGGKAGTLALPLPAQMLIFKADIHDGSDQGMGPNLYKEFRFKGSVGGGTGFFKPGIVTPTSYFLVFQGRGNGCDNASDFTHWRLEINGRKASYAFFGGMNTTDAPGAKINSAIMK